MSESNAAVKVRILGRDYTIACEPDEEAALHESAQLLDERMRHIRDAGGVVGMDRIAVMAALNIAHEFLRTDASHRFVTRDVTDRLARIHSKVESALGSRHLSS